MANAPGELAQPPTGRRLSRPISYGFARIALILSVVVATASSTLVAPRNAGVRSLFIAVMRHSVQLLLMNSAPMMYGSDSRRTFLLAGASPFSSHASELAV